MKNPLTYAKVILAAPLAMIAGAVETVSDTCESAYKLVDAGNTGIHLAADRAVVTQVVRDKIKRADLEAQAMEHLIAYGEQEDSLRERAEKLADQTASALADRKEEFKAIFESHKPKQIILSPLPA